MNYAELARQGDPHAIADLINRNLQPKGIAAKTSLKEACLKILLESEDVPDQKILANYIYQGVKRLEIPSIQKMVVFGRKAGEDIPAWSQEFELGSQHFNPSDWDNATDLHMQSSSEEVRCPLCRSNQISVSKKGFGVGKAAVGALLLGPLGLAGGMLGSRKVFLSCLKCGHQWEPKGATKILEAVPALPAKAVLTLPAKVVPALPPEVIASDFSTPATLNPPTFFFRVALAVFSFLGLGGFGLVIWIIPLIGWILCPLSLLGAIIMPFVFLFSDAESLTNWAGHCPYCKKDIAIPKEKTRGNCSHCKGTIIIKDQKFYAVER